MLMKFRSIVDKPASLISRLWHETEQVRAIPGKFLGKEFFTIPWGLWLLLSFIGLGGYLIITEIVLIELIEETDWVPLTVGFIGALFVGAVGVVNLYVNYRRTREFENSTKEQRLSDERRDYQYLYASSFRYLEHEKESVRLSAVYGLVRLAKSSQHSKNPWASDIAKIMSSHIRSITNEDNYQNRNKPSSYISAILRLLIPTTDEREKNPFGNLQFDLKDCYLRGANLENLHLVGADLTNAKLIDTHLNGADLRSADLTDADLRGAIFKSKKLLLRGAVLKDTIISLSDLRAHADFAGTDISGIIDADKITNQEDSTLADSGQLPSGSGPELGLGFK